MKYPMMKALQEMDLSTRDLHYHSQTLNLCGTVRGTLHPPNPKP